jgi:hypothetical protein
MLRENEVCQAVASGCSYGNIQEMSFSQEKGKLMKWVQRE